MLKRAMALLLCLLLALFALTGCAMPNNSPPSLPTGARQTLTVYTSHPLDVYGPIIKEFEERTGVWTTVVTGNTLDLFEQIANESNAPVADVIFGGGAESHEAYRAFFQNYQSPEAENVLPFFKSENNMWTPFSALPIVLVYNTKLVSAKNAPTGWAQLAQPHWQGLTAFTSPTVSASSFTAISTLMQVSAQNGWAEMEQLASNVQGKMVERSADITAAVASGNFLVGIALEEVALRYIQAGSDIAIVYPTEGTSVVPDAISLVQNAPNANNARLFIDFILSRDVQQMLVNDMSRRSVRADIKEYKGLVPLNEITVLQYDYAFSAEIREPVLAYWQGL
ncbi:extracellular solute-binding protein [Ruminococcaceae bacterium OttesenSCG-928-A16]|nr:extracellular solute-binding protein [Ruminococcaceae bacterium OttesenSCG-928-A16]